MHGFRRTCAAVFTIGGCLLGAANPARAQTEVEQLRARVTQLEKAVTTLSERIAQLEAGKKPAAPAELTITVLPDDWGASTADVAAVCRSAATELTRSIPDRATDPITVSRDVKQGPMVIYGRGVDGERRVLLNSGDRLWAQIAFQFAHEVCHIQCNYRDKEKSNLWFEESLCETASLFALRRMAETWKTKPPYGNWKSYAPALQDYADKRIAQVNALENTTLAEWYRRNESALRNSGIDRDKNNVVAVALLPLLEKNPRHWRAVRFLNLGDPQATLSFPQFLREWHDRVPAEHREFVEAVGGLFEIAMK